MTNQSTSHQTTPSPQAKPAPSLFEGQAAVVEAGAKGAQRPWLRVLALAGGALLAGAGWLGLKAMNDPMRVLPVFPEEKYFANPDAIAGSTFKADLRVEADLGWRMGAGRLLSFSLLHGGQRLAVLVPAKIAGATFDKNQVYCVELAVEEGGLIRAKSFKKL